jgi:IS30 family transposase
MAQALQRSLSTISRELRRNSREGHYGSVAAHRHCQTRRLQARPLGKLHSSTVRFDVVRHFLGWRWSPEQNALTMTHVHPKGHPYRVSTETIYRCIYAQPVGELRQRLIASLRQARNKHVPRSKGKDRRGHIPDQLSIHLRPPEIEDRQFTGHWEGDLIKGEGNASAVGTLVERTSRLLILVKLPHPKSATAANVLQAFTDNKLQGIAAPLHLSLTYDQGKEMPYHRKLTEATGVAVYFCDPRLQREHQRPGSIVPAQRNRPVLLHAGTTGCHC